MPVDQLSALARALLSADLGGRDVIPEHVAYRVTALAAEWSAYGFTHDTVRQWVDLPPACAAYLAERGIDPSVLDQPVDPSPTAAPTTFRRALARGDLGVDHAVDLLTGADGPNMVAPSTTPPPTPAAAGMPRQHPTSAPPRPAPALFSHPTTDHNDPDDTGHRRRVRPSQTPFRPQTGT